MTDQLPLVVYEQHFSAHASWLAFGTIHAGVSENTV